MTDLKTGGTDPRPDVLEGYFQAERHRNGAAPRRLLEGVMRDAAALRADPPSHGVRPPDPVSWWRRDFWRALGVWPTAAALSACLALGISLGYAAPAGVETLAASVLSQAGFAEIADSGYSMLDDILAGG